MLELSLSPLSLPASSPSGSLDSGAVPTFDRALIAAVLTAQWAIGGILITAFALLGWLVAMLVPEVGQLEHLLLVLGDRKAQAGIADL